MTSVCLGTRFLQASAFAALLGALVLPVREAAADACGYPFGSGRTAVVFNESTVLRTFTPGNAVTVIVPTGGSTGLKIRAFYSDEHALSLGAEKAGCAGTVASNSAISCVNVSASGVGCLTATDPSGRPIFPALFLTDLGPIGSPSGSTSGDWQQQNDPSNLNPTAIPPDHVCGPTKKATIDASGNITMGTRTRAAGTWARAARSSTSGRLSRWRWSRRRPTCARARRCSCARRSTRRIRAYRPTRTPGPSSRTRVS